MATAEDFKFTIERGVRSARDPAEVRSLPSIVGLEEFLAGRVGGIAGVEAPSPRELRIRLRRVNPRLLHFLAGPRCWLVAREAVETYGEALGEHPVGTGPFRRRLPSQIRSPGALSLCVAARRVL